MGRRRLGYPERPAGRKVKSPEGDASFYAPGARAEVEAVGGSRLLKRSAGASPGNAQLPAACRSINAARGGGCLEPILREACSQAYPVSAICVQRFDDSLSSAIRITYRISLRSSSLREPRYPLLRVVLVSYV